MSKNDKIFIIYHFLPILINQLIWTNLQLSNLSFIYCKNCLRMSLMLHMSCLLKNKLQAYYYHSLIYAPIKYYF